MHERSDNRSVLVVRHTGELDESATRHLLDEVRDRTTSETTLIVVSLAGATAVHWNALCSLARGAQSWRSSHRDVVVKGARPSIRAVLASAAGIG